jgi:hypothetical protein
LDEAAADADAEDEDEADLGGSLLHNLPTHEPTQKIEKTTPTMIPMTPVICMAVDFNDDTKLLKKLKSFSLYNPDKM